MAAEDLCQGKGREDVRADNVVIAVIDNSGGGRGRHILKRPQKVRASDART